MSRSSLPPADAELVALLDALRRRGLVSAAVALTAGPGGGERLAWVGSRRLDSELPIAAADRFDLASLTKSFTATLALALDRSGLLPLELELGEIWPRLDRRLAGRPLCALLRHRVGLRPWMPLYRTCRRPSGVAARLLSGEWLGARVESYGDLDFILWGLSAERLLGRSFEALMRRHVLRPLGLGSVGWSPGARRGIVQCALDNRREVELAAAAGIRVAPRGAPPPGVAQDGNARFFGGVAAHAGLFGSAVDLLRLGREWLRPGRVLDEEGVADALSGGRRFTLGWRRSTVGGSAGPALGREAFGQIGFTGGSLWIDPARDRIAVLMTQRSSVDSRLESWRRRFHAIAVAG